MIVKSYTFGFSLITDELTLKKELMVWDGGNSSFVIGRKELHGLKPNLPTVESTGR